MTYPLDRQSLNERIEAGDSFEYYFFYGHKQKGEAVDASCLSQWFPCSFEIEGITYSTAEHWMMACKARLFEDNEMLEQILDAPDPKAAKALGRKVRNFDGETWGQNNVRFVTEGNLAKFHQNPDLNSFLQSTGETIIVEAAGRDVIWGIGLGASNPKAQDPRTWRGRNLLGFVLTDVREQLR